jgi:excisionase family DNA binding protein
MQELLTVSEAAELLGVHADTLRRWETEGRIGRAERGSNRERLFREGDVRALADELRTRRRRLARPRFVSLPDDRARAPEVDPPVVEREEEEQRGEEGGYPPWWGTVMRNPDLRMLFADEVRQVLRGRAGDR